MGADVVIGVDVSSDITKFSDGSGLDIVLRADAVTRIYLNNILLAEADVLVHPNVGMWNWADFSGPRELFSEGEKATLEKLLAIRSAIHRVVAPQKTIVEHIKTIKDKIMEKVVGGK